MNLKYREVKHVYDEDGNMYEWYGEKLESGYLVRPVYDATTFYWCDGHEIPEPDVSYGKYTILEQIFDHPPVQKKEEKIKELEEEIKKLNEDIKKKQEEKARLYMAQSMTVEDVLREKLKGAVNTEELEILVKALTNELKLYTVTDTGNIIRKDSVYVAVHLNDRLHPIHFFKRSGENWIKYNCNQVKSDPDHVSFTSLELAEEYVINQVNSGNILGKNITECAQINSMFKKRGLKPPENWMKHVKDILKNGTERAWDDIISQYELIKEREKSIKEIEKFIEELENYCSLDDLLTEERINDIKFLRYCKSPDSF